MLLTYPKGLRRRVCVTSTALRRFLGYWKLYHNKILIKTKPQNRRGRLPQSHLATIEGKPGQTHTQTHTHTHTCDLYMYAQFRRLPAPAGDGKRSWIHENISARTNFVPQLVRYIVPLLFMRTSSNWTSCAAIWALSRKERPLCARCLRMVVCTPLFVCGFSRYWGRRASNKNISHDLSGNIFLRNPIFTEKLLRNLTVSDGMNAHF